MHVDRHWPLVAAGLLIAAISGWGQTAGAESLVAGPKDYLSLISQLEPGDELQLRPGIYRSGLNLKGLHGEAGNPIVISGPPDRSALFLGRPGRNTIELRDVSHLQISNLTLNGRNAPRADGVKSHGIAHHITLENLEIVNHASHQQNVGISTKAPAWNWVIRNNIIRGAGTGLYLGDSNGSAPFVHGIIERNLIVDTIGYGLQIKHQGPRLEISGMPVEPGSTIIRHNIISKARQPTDGFQGPRPNLFVGHFPLLGTGLEDVYEIYGNLLYQNLVNQPLFQGEGNIAFYNNLLVNHHGDGAWFQPHNDLPRRIAIFQNTVVAKGLGIAVIDGNPEFTQEIAGNAAFAAMPIVGGHQKHNLSADFAAAENFLRAPFGDWPQLDLRPRPGRLKSGPGPALVARFAGADRDFSGNPRDGSWLGAYAGPNMPKEGLMHFPPAL
ncbi:MAG: right-handed parallel beta-helix repeat-containing protein [Kiloniellaceae bacterium]